MTNYLTKQQYSAAKRRLTMAKKKGPEAVLAEVTSTYSQWDDGGYAYPDSWHDWERARNDAQWELRLR